MPYHIPALLNETIDGLMIKPDGTYVDVTFGGGGHSRAILKAGANQLYSFDQDADALDNRIDDDRWHFVHSNFRYLSHWLAYYGEEKIDGLLADLGVSFHHFDTSERGFSFRFEGPLDMRMNRSGGKTATEIISQYTEEELSNVLYLYGELRNARQLARKMKNNPVAIETTQDLTLCLAGKTAQKQANGEWDIVDPRVKKDVILVYQALRIEVNDEMGALKEMLVAAQERIRQGGRIAILTYHSLEDRLVKNFLRSGNINGEIEKDFYGNIISPWKLINKNVITASVEEIERNPRSRSAKLRIAERQ